MSARLPDYYAILHVDPRAPAEIIRASYRTLIQRLRAHPDLGGDHDAAAALNVAYATLKDPRKRAEYDALRAEHAPAAAASSSSREPEPPPRRASHTYSATPETAPGGDDHRSTGVWHTAEAPQARVAICPFCGASAGSGKAAPKSADSCRSCTAPLTLVRTLGGNSSEQQRSVYRIAKAESLRIFVRPQDRSGIEAHVQDISVTGIRFSCGSRLDIGAVIRADCEMCACVARIAHVSQLNAELTQYGAQFLTVRFKRQRGSLLSVPA